MSLISYKLGTTSIALRVKILDSAATTGAGKTGLTSASSGLQIGTIANNEATSTAYTVAGSTIETITTLGTYAAPTATKCRFKEVDATNHKGIYEIQIADARYAVSGAKSLLISISGPTDAAETDVLIPLTQFDPYDAVRGGMTALPNAAADAAGGLPISDAGGLDIDTLLGRITANVALASVCTETRLAELDAANLPTDIATAQADLDIITGADGVNLLSGTQASIDAIEAVDVLGSQMTEAYAADGVAPTLTEAIMLLLQRQTEFAIAGTTITIKKLDGTTTAATLTMDSDTAPTSSTRAT